MIVYKRIEPPDFLTPLIRYFWVVENPDTTIKRQTIVPDGFPEIIFHYGDPYRINISGTWELQERKLLAGQIRNHFLLENTGASGMLGIKFEPTGIAALFGLNMEALTDTVVNLDSRLKSEFETVSDELVSKSPHTGKIERLNRLFGKMQGAGFARNMTVHRALELIFRSKGALSVYELAKMAGTSERTLERLFKKWVGLSPKFYSRIIRFNYIFSLVQERKMSWSELTQISGYYDQPHFIKDFREFTGVEPSKYFFEDETLTNFFQSRPAEK